MTLLRSFVLRARWSWLVLVLGMAGIIALATLTPPGRMPQGPAGLDKVFHALAFGALVLPAALLRPDRLLVVLLFAIAYGGLIELIQPLVGRSAEWADLLADALGALAGAGLGLALRRGLLRRETHSRG
jgi:VanZ family protein